MQLHDSAMAAGCLTWARMLVDAQLKATSTQTVAGGLGNVSRVVRLAERLLECFGDSAEMLDHVKRQLQELLAALQNPGPQAVRQAMSQYLAWKDLALHSQTARWGTPFGKLAWLFPAPRFLMAAETAALAEAFAKADSFLTLEYPERMYDGPMVRILMQPLAGNHHSLRSLDLLAQSRIQALLVLTAVVRYRLNHAGALPPALAALVPECLDELPADPLAAGQPYRLTQEEISLQVWNFHQAGIETVKRGALVVRSTNSSDVLAMLLLTAR